MTLIPYLIATAIGSYALGYLCGYISGVMSRAWNKPDAEVFADEVQEFVKIQVRKGK